MHFHLLFISKETYEKNISYGIIFTPCPVFIKHTKKILIPNKSNPEYELGSIKKLINEEVTLKNLQEQKKVCLLIQEIGHGTKKDLDTLIQDLKDNKFEINIINI